MRSFWILVSGLLAGPCAFATALSPLGKPVLPIETPSKSMRDGRIYFGIDNSELLPTTLNKEMQEHLETYLRDHGQPIAAAVVAEVATGRILALVQGQDPREWGGDRHTALFPGFPAASLFKSVVAAAAFEMTGWQPETAMSLVGGCAHVRPTGVWLRDVALRVRNKMTLRRAYGRSCNSFFAKMAVNYLGMGVISQFAERFGWGWSIPADFDIPQSPIIFPTVQAASTHTVGRFAAGFGRVAISPVHAAWMALVMAHDGKAAPLRLFENSSYDKLLEQSKWRRIFRASTGRKLREIMDATVRGGTASFAFRRGKHRALRYKVGGKTGTLTGTHPPGLTTWFIGVMPIDRPQVVVASVVVNKSRWVIKGAHLAAEALWAYSKYGGTPPISTAAGGGSGRPFKSANGSL